MLGALLGIGSLIGNFMGKSAEGAAKGRMTQAQLQAEQDRTLTDQYQTRQGAEMQAGNLDLSRKGFSEDARGNRAKQAMIGALLGGGLQDVNINVPGIQTATISGGLRPSALGESGQAAGKLLNKQALERMLMGDKFEGGNILKAPGVQAIPKASTWEKIAGIGGLIGSGMGVANQAMQQYGGAPSVPGIPFASGAPAGSMPGNSVDTSLPAAPTGMAEVLAAIKQLTDGGSVQGRT